MVCFNPRLRDKRRRKRGELLHAAEDRLEEIAQPAAGKDRVCAARRRSPGASTQPSDASRSPSTSRSDARTAISHGAAGSTGSTAKPRSTDFGSSAPASTPTASELTRRWRRTNAWRRSSRPSRQIKTGRPGIRPILRLRRSPHPRLPVNARLPRRMAHEKEAGSDPVRQGRSKGRPGAARLAGRTRETIALGPSQGHKQKHAGRDGRAEPPHPARRSFDRRSERRLHRRIRKLQTGRGPRRPDKKGHSISSASIRGRCSHKLAGRTPRIAFLQRKACVFAP